MDRLHPREQPLIYIGLTIAVIVQLSGIDFGAVNGIIQAVATWPFVSSAVRSAE